MIALWELIVTIFQFFIVSSHQKIEKKIMRHRIKAGKVGSFTPEKQKVEIEQLENREVVDEVEEIFEEDSEFSTDDEALAAMEFYDSPDETEWH